ncbi:hypothetical protein FE784_08865 [Paenibacillus hemerocallicola]|uniref:Copper amine oxidase-like N-terminal domain-containing protein n=1 Tax=Paenibacillus hemerocallicola TaxID=1172614 RepID=A0A5C4TC66_9BACL|nr:hypothetical protein [Paenibacillus hemerocallicola]TNJ66668.1 hypothetical protein FE784_08865 [Paenibacillus hemerocallicola]
MKKYLIGALFGFLLSLSISVYGEEVKSVIGAVIDGELPVSVNGEKLGNRAITIAGTSYLPVREFAEKVGYDVAFAAASGISLERKPFDLLDPINVGKEFLTKKSVELGAFQIDGKTANAQEIKKLNQSKMHIRIQREVFKNNDFLASNAIFYNDIQKSEKIEYLQYILNAMEKNLEQIKTSASKSELETYEKYVSSLQNELTKTLQTAPSANEPAVG